MKPCDTKRQVTFLPPPPTSFECVENFNFFFTGKILPRGEIFNLKTSDFWKFSVNINEGEKKESENCHICIFGFFVVWPKIHKDDTRFVLYF